jgi:hypothetical protein
MTEREMWAENSYRTPPVFCWHCHQVLDALTRIEGGSPDPVGSLALCLYCGAMALVADADLNLRPPTHEELDELRDDEDFCVDQFIPFMWARQKMMLDAHIRDRSEGRSEGL